MSFDKAEASRAFGRKYRFPFPLVSDESREVGILYGACDTRDEEFAARIAYLIGPDGRIVESHAKVSPATYPEEQLGTLRVVANSRGQ